jgi:NAD(P)-dependent dehydrogenase (short-subunit alcohol dehydrogenase family)
VGDRKSAKAFVEFCREKLGEFDLLINNASILGERVSIEKYPEEVWEEVLNSEAVLKNNALEVGRDNIRFHAKK